MISELPHTQDWTVNFGPLLINILLNLLCHARSFCFRDVLGFEACDTCLCSFISVKYSQWRPLERRGHQLLCVFLLSCLTFSFAGGWLFYWVHQCQRAAVFCSQLTNMAGICPIPSGSILLALSFVFFRSKAGPNTGISLVRNNKATLMARHCWET